MPTVIQSNVLPYQPTLRDKLLEAFISAAPQFLMTGLQGGFNQPKVPNPTYGQAGDLRFPSGASTPTTPQELQQIIQRGGVPTTQGTLSPYQNIPAPFANQRTLRPPEFKALNDLQAYQQAQEKARQDAAMAPLERQAKQSTIDVNQSIAGYNKALLPVGGSPTAGGAYGSNVGGPQINQLYSIASKADAGDPTAQAVMEYLLSQR